MGRKTRDVDVIRKYTTYTGDLDFEGDGFPVDDGSEGYVTYWRGPVAASGTFSLEIQGSVDGERWTTLMAGDPGSDGEQTQTIDVDYPIWRYVVKLTGTSDVAVTCWCRLTLVLRR